MLGLSLVHAGILFGVVYATSLVVLFLVNRREFHRCPEKRERYQALPLGYKLACWFVVVPVFAGTLLRPELFLGGIVSYSLLEGLCVRWYRKAGLLS